MLNAKNIQDQIKQRFDTMYREGNTPWKEHGKDKLFDAFVFRLTTIKHTPTVLDLGCGDGWLSLQLAALGAEVWGIDSSPTAISAAKAFADARGYTGLTHFAVGDALDLPFEDHFFDAIVDRGLFHHILPANRSAYFASVERVSRSGTLMYLIVFSRKSPVGIGQRFEKKDIETLFGEKFETVIDAEDSFPGTAPAHLLHFILKKIGPR